MSSISWTSSSLSSYINTSLNLDTSSGINSIYTTLTDASLIKSGSYKKLMSAYYDSQSSTSSSSSSSSDSDSTTSTKSKACSYTYDSNASTTSSIRNTVLDDLLDKSEKTSTVSSTVLDELLALDDEDEATDEDGTVVDKSETSTTAETGSVIDESV